MKRLSPLRYPGGKGQMYEQIKFIIQENALASKTYVEPFAGGFAVGLSLLQNGVINSAIINDIDFHIYAFWKAVFYRHNEIINKLYATPITIEEWHRQKKIYEKCNKRAWLNVAFATLFLNRTNFSGVIKGGPIGGIEQKGKFKLDCRFPKDRLAEIICATSKFRKQVEIYNMDAKSFIKKVLSLRQNDIFVNFDPPYVKKGKSLYLNFYEENDHKELKDCIERNLECDWIMTYDNHKLIKEIYSKYPLKKFSLNYSANEHRNAKEIFISTKKYKNTISV